MQPTDDVFPCLGLGVSGSGDRYILQAKTRKPGDLDAEVPWSHVERMLVRLVKSQAYQADMAWVGDNRAMRRLAVDARVRFHIVRSDPHSGELTFEDVYGPSDQDFAKITTALRAVTPEWGSGGMPTRVTQSGWTNLTAPEDTSLLDGAARELAEVFVFLRRAVSERVDAVATVGALLELFMLIVRACARILSVQHPVPVPAEPPGRACARTPRAPRPPSEPQSTPSSCGSLALL